MPQCRLCKKVQATAEVRKTTKGHVCMDKYACAQRQKKGE